MSEPATDTAPLPTARRRRRRRWPIVVLVLVVVVALLCVAAVVGERVFKQQAEHQIELDVQGSLPSGVDGYATATIHGGPALLQWASGHFDDVTIALPGLTVNGAPATAHAEVHDLPVNGGRLGSATLTVGVDADTVESLAPLAGTGASAPKLGNDRIATTVTRKVLGIAVLVAVSLKPSVVSGQVRLDPVTATLRSGAISVPGTAIVKTLYPNGITVCAAKYLPKGVVLKTLAVRSSGVTLGLTARDIDLATLQSGGTGRC